VITVGVTGATGFLGSYLRRRLPALGAFQLRALTRTLAIESHPVSERLAWMQGDLNQPADCADFVHGLDVVIHLAHTNTPLTSNKYLPGDALANLLPFLNLIEAIRAAGTRPHVILASSGGGVYGPVPDHQPLREDHPCAPSTSYGIQKIAAELYLQLAATNGWLTAISLRISNPYGVLLPMQRRQGFIGVAVNCVLSGQPVRVFGNPENVRDYVHLEDVAHAVAASMRESGPCRTYNIGSGEGLSVHEVLRAIETLLGRPVDVQYELEPTGSDLTPWNVLDITRAKRELGWRPEIAFDDGLRELLTHVVA
jgi:UDP-glucose 4-epimerase